MKFSNLNNYAYFTFNNMPNVMYQKISDKIFLRVEGSAFRTLASDGDVTEFTPQFSSVKDCKFIKKNLLVKDMRVGDRFTTANGEFIKISYDKEIIINLMSGLPSVLTEDTDEVLTVLD